MFLLSYAILFPCHWLLLVTATQQWDLGIFARSGSNFTTSSGLGTDSDSDPEQPLDIPSQNVLQSEMIALNEYIDDSKANFLKSRIGRNYKTISRELMKVDHFSVTNGACLGLGSMQYKLEEHNTEDLTDARAVEQLAAFEALLEILSTSHHTKELTSS